MFKRFSQEECVSSQSQVKSSVGRGIRQAIVEQYPRIEEVLDDLLPKKDPMVVAKCTNHIQLLVVRGEPLFFQQRDGPWYPTLRLVHRHASVFEPVGWRTDAGATILTAFCALQDIDATMGPTLFLPATHTAEAHADFFTYETFDLVFDSGDDEEDEAEQEEDRELAARTAALLESWSACRAELGAGDVALYDGRCLHAGDANTSPRQRVLFYCSFATAEHARTSTRGTILDDLRGKHALSDWREWTWSSSED